MNAPAISHCQFCGALINPRWYECAACHKPFMDWLSAWRELAHITSGFTKDDPRFEPVMRWLNIADYAFSIDSWSCFVEAAERVKAIAKGR